jgi:hypothetical protein
MAVAVDSEICCHFEEADIHQYRNGVVVLKYGPLKHSNYFSGSYRDFQIELYKLSDLEYIGPGQRLDFDHTIVTVLQDGGLRFQNKYMMGESILTKNEALQVMEAVKICMGVTGFEPATLSLEG